MREWQTGESFEENKYMEIKNQIEIYKKDVNSVVSKANSLEIKSVKNMELAVDALKEVKVIASKIKEAKEKYTKPANEILKTAKLMFGPIETAYKAAEQIIKAKMINFDEKMRKEALAKTEKIAEDVRKGKLDITEAGEKMDKIEPKNSYSGENGSVSYRINEKVSIVSLDKIPRKYLLPDLVLIKADLKSGIKVPGAELIQEKIVVGR